MPRLGGINIPFVVDMSDIPRSIKAVESQLKQLQKRVGAVHLKLNGKQIEELNKSTIVPFVRNFTRIETAAKNASARINVLSRAIKQLREQGGGTGMQTQLAGFISPESAKAYEKYLQQRAKTSTAVGGDLVVQQKKLNTAKGKLINLLKQEKMYQRDILKNKERELVVSASPKMTYTRRVEIEQLQKMSMQWKELITKRKLGLITQRESIKLGELANRLAAKREKSSVRRLALEKQLRIEAGKALKAQRTGGLFPGGGLFSIGRLGWFVQLRAYWEILRVIQKIVTAFVDLDEAVGRAMRTMTSETLDYDEIAERTEKTILRVGAVTGATYKDIGEALYQLSSAGLSAEESLAAVNSVMRLTRTTETEVTDATKVIAGVFNNFKDIVASATSDTEAFARISGILSYVWERNQVDMNEMVQALNQSAQISQLAGLRFEDLTVILGNLGTMMIRSGRGGRSLRTAIIQMAARGKELADSFDLAFDPTQPVNFIRVMDKLYESFKDLNHTALVTEKITSIFGRRGAPAILALLRNWSKVREEIGGIGSTLDLTIKQQEKLIRLQERYRQINETVWNEILENLADYVNVVELAKSAIFSILEGTRRERAREITGMTTPELIAKFGDAGKLLEEIARARALHNVALTRSVKRLREDSTAWTTWGNAVKGAWDKSKSAAYEGADIYDKLSSALYKAFTIQKTIETLQQDKAREEDIISRPIITEKQAWDALLVTLADHHAIRGELVYTGEQLSAKLLEEYGVLGKLKNTWVSVYMTHRGNEELMKGVTKELTDQADDVRKLADTLLKLHKFEETILKRQQKRELAFYDARIKAQNTYAESVEKWTGVVENREVQAIKEKIDHVKVEQSQMQALIALKQPVVSAYEALAEAGKLPPEVVEKWNELTTQIQDLKLQSKLAGKEIERLKIELLFATKAAEMLPAILERRKKGIYPSAAGFEEVRRPGALAGEEATAKRRQEHELKLLDIKQEAEERYQHVVSLWRSKSELVEEAELARNREKLTLERQHLTERIQNVRAQIVANDQLAESLTAPTEERDKAAAAAANLRNEEQDLNNQLDENTKAYVRQQLTVRAEAKKTIEAQMEAHDYIKAGMTLWDEYGDTVGDYGTQMFGMWKDMAAQAGEHNKKMWDRYKALAISQVITSSIVTGWKGASALAGIPYIGPVLAAAWVATVAAQAGVAIAQIESQKPTGYASGGVVYGDLIMLDRQRGRRGAYATGGMTSGPTMAMVGDNPSGREIIIPEENISDDHVSGYWGKRGSEPLNIINLVTQEDVAAAMSGKLGKNVVINHIGADMQQHKSTYREVRKINKRR